MLRAKFEVLILVSKWKIFTTKRLTLIIPDLLTC